MVGTFPMINPPIKVAPVVAREYITENINIIITFAMNRAVWKPGLQSNVLFVFHSFLPKRTISLPKPPKLLVIVKNIQI